MSSNDADDLVLGVIRGYSFARIQPFVDSLRRAGFPGSIVMLCNTVSNATKRALAVYGVKCQDFQYRGEGAGNSWARYWPLLAPLIRCLGQSCVTREILKAISPLQTARFLYYRDFLTAKGTYRNVLISDVRDVIFQSNPFADFGGGIEVFQETARIKLGEQFHNANWMRETFGPDVFARIGGYPVLCSGTILGERESLLALLGEFECLLGRVRRIDIIGSDQAVYNFLCRLATKQQITLVENGSGRVGTLGTSRLDGVEFSFSPRDGVRGANGQIMPVVHQFDRHPELTEHFYRAFPLVREYFLRPDRP